MLDYEWVWWTQSWDVFDPISGKTRLRVPWRWLARLICAIDDWRRRRQRSDRDVTP